MTHRIIGIFKFLPSPCKCSLCSAAVVKSREEMKHWKKLFFTEATRWHPHRSHGLLAAESQTQVYKWLNILSVVSKHLNTLASQRWVGTGNQTTLCTDCTGSAGRSLPLLPPWEHRTWTSKPQAHTTSTR